MGKILVDPDGTCSSTVRVDDQGNIYYIYASGIGCFSPDGKPLAQIEEQYDIWKGPRDFDLGPSGTIVLVDDSAPRIVRFDPAARALAYLVTEEGKRPGQLKYPDKIAVDSAGNFIVGDAQNHLLQKFAPDGKLLWAYNTPIKFIDDDEREIPWERPRIDGLCVDRKDNIYILHDNGWLIRFDPQGVPVQWAGIGGAGVAVDPEGNVHVSAVSGWDELDDAPLVKIDPSFMLLAVFGSEGDQPGEFDQPKGLALDKAGNLYVADTRNKRIQVVDKGEWKSAEPLQAPCTTARHEEAPRSAEEAPKKKGFLAKLLGK